MVHSACDILKRRPEHNILIDGSLPFIRADGLDALSLTGPDNTETGLVGRMHHHIRPFSNDLLRQLAALVGVIGITNIQGLTFHGRVRISHPCLKTGTELVDNRLVRTAYPGHPLTLGGLRSHHAGDKRRFLRLHNDGFHISQITGHIAVHHDKLRVREIRRYLDGLSRQIVPHHIDGIGSGFRHSPNLLAVLRLIKSLYYLRLNAVFLPQLLHTCIGQRQKWVSLGNGNNHRRHFGPCFIFLCLLLLPLRRRGLSRLIAPTAGQTDYHRQCQ